jgi:hypothetical protein
VVAAILGMQMMLQAGREKSQDEELHRQRGPIECGLAWAVAGLQLSVDGFETLESAQLADRAWVVDQGGRVKARFFVRFGLQYWGGGTSQSLNHY